MRGKGAPAGGGFGTTRIEALADGIFAVAMTLLVLDVKLPNGEHFATSGALCRASGSGRGDAASSACV